MTDAKAQLGALVERANREGPQGITVRGKPVAVLLSATDYARLTRRDKSLAAFMAASPLAGLDLDLSRDGSGGRVRLTRRPSPAPRR